MSIAHVYATSDRHARHFREVCIQRDNRRVAYKESRQDDDFLNEPEYVSFNSEEPAAQIILKEIPLHETESELFDRMYARILLQAEKTPEDVNWINYQYLVKPISENLRIQEGSRLRSIVCNAMDAVERHLEEIRANEEHQQGILPIEFFIECDFDDCSLN